MPELFSIPGHELPYWASPLASGESFVLDSLPNEDYHSTKALISKSTLDIAARSGQHYLHSIAPERCPGYHEDDEFAADPDENKEALIVGNAFHTLVLEPMAFSRRYVVMPPMGDMRSSKNRDFRDAWIKNEAGGRTPLKADSMRMIQRMRESLMRERFMKKLLDSGRPEVTVGAIDPHTGLPCKSRTDWLADIGIGFDLKSAIDGSKRAWRLEAGRRRLAVQATFYPHVFKLAGIELDQFVFGVVEKVAPYPVGLYSFDEIDLIAGEQLYMRNLRDIRRWIETDEFPGYTGGVVETITLPSFQRQDAEEALSDLPG